MKTKLYSYADIELAQSIFPQQFKQGGWLEEQWTDDEINALKSLQMKAFIEAPSLLNYPKSDCLNSVGEMPEDVSIANDYCRRKEACQTFLSVACGFGEKELMIAKDNPHIDFVAIDNSPYVESINAVAKELKLKNIQFKRCDLREVNLGKFDIVYSFAVIYCIPDEYLMAYFEKMMNSLNPHGFALVGCCSNYSLVEKILHLKSKITSLFRGGGRQRKAIGWQRDLNHLMSYLPKNITVDKTFKFNHFANIGNGVSIRNAIGWGSKNIYSMSNSSYMLVLRQGII